jgi:hypothetical protein
MACGLCVPLAARADSSNPNLFPLGENESFLGNTGVGRAVDTGAVYYNPAGLAELPSGRIAVSGALYLSFSTHADAFVNLDNTNVPFDASGFVTIPSLYVATRRLGDWVGALSVLVPESLQLDNRLPFTTPSRRGNIVYSQSLSELWIGLSAARKLDERWSLGLTVFGIQRQQTQTLGLDLQSTATATEFTSSISQLSLNTFGLSATLGLSYLAADWLRFGLRAQTALVQLFGSGTSYQVTHNPSGTPPTSVEDVHGDANYAMPFDFSVGTAVLPFESLTLLADVSLQLEAPSYSTFPASGIFNETIVLKTTPRFNVGVEVRPSPAFPVRLGGFYNPSARGGTPGDANYSKDDYYGLSGGIGFNDAHVRTTLGGFYTQSSGSMTPVGALGTTASVSNRGGGVLLTTAYVF